MSWNFCGWCCERCVVGHGHRVTCFTGVVAHACYVSTSEVFVFTELPHFSDMHDLCLQHAAHILSLHLLFLLPQCFPLLRHNPSELSHLLVLVGLPHSRTDAIAEEKVRCNVLGEGGAQLKHPSMCSEIEWARLGECTKQSVAQCTHRSWLPLVCLGPSCASWVSFSARSSLPKGLDSSRKRSCPVYPWMPSLLAEAHTISSPPCSGSCPRLPCLGISARECT